MILTYMIRRAKQQNVLKIVKHALEPLDRVHKGCVDINMTYSR
jgi:hypothetical protein